MKYLGKITDDKDLVTKEYVDNAVAGGGGGGVTGVKGNSESTYRTGNVNITKSNILDLCTGSGCISVALKKKFGLKYSTEGDDNKKYFASVNALAEYISAQKK